MTDAELENVVAEFLERREGEPDLSPEAFVRDRLEGDATLAAIRHTLDLLSLFPSESSPLLPLEAKPDHIGPYRVHQTIGRGGMGVVYEVEREGKHFALKVHTPALHAPSHAGNRFQREVLALTQLRHPSIVAVEDWGVHDGSPYVVMELLEGKALSELDSAPPANEAARIVRDLARAVHAVHGAGLLHRDLKPSNVILSPDGSPVLIDFGLIAAEDLPSMTAEGALLGTPRYMAPEQASGEPVDARTDVYALGLILYELVTGTAPRASASRDRVLAVARSGDLVRPRRCADVPSPLERILLQATAKEPVLRYDTAADLGADLDRYLQGQPVHAPRRHPWTGLVRSMARHPARALLGGAALILFGVAVVSLLQRPDDLGRAAAAQRETDEAVHAWFEGDIEASQEALVRALQRPHLDPSVRALAAHLGLEADASDAEARALSGVLNQWETDDRAIAFDALVALREAGHGSTLHSLLLGFAASEHGDLKIAERELRTAAQHLKASPMLALELGRVLLRRGDPTAARRELERAVELDAESSDAWAALADCCGALGDLDAGVDAARRALAAAPDRPARARRVLAGILDRRGAPEEREEARSLFEELLAEDPRDAAALFGRAVGLDRDHRIDEAARDYRKAFEVDSDHSRAALYLANLLSGAHRGVCASCDAAFAGHPELLDESQAERYLLQGLRADGGRTESFHRVALEIALRLQDRNGVIQGLEDLIGTGERTPEILRLVDLQRNIEARGIRK